MMNKICRRFSVVTAFVLMLPVASYAEETDRLAGLSDAVGVAASEALEKCAAGIQAFCSDVHPGESRVLACLQAYQDQVSDVCREVLGQWQRPDLFSQFQTTQSYPTLEHRDLGQQNLDEEGERVIWEQKLPFLAQKVIDLGFELPKAYGVAIIPARIRQDLVL